MPRSSGNAHLRHPRCFDEEVAEVFEPLLDLIRECFDRYYGEDAGVADNLRRAVCRVDFAMYGH